MQALVAGAGRGIGLAWVDRLLEQAHWTRVYALYRSASDELEQRQAKDSRLVLLAVDQSSDTDLERLAGQLQGELNWVINTAGFLHSEAQGVQPEKSLRQLDRQALQLNFQTNAINHLLLIKALQPCLCKKGELRVASLSARVGSIEDNRLGGWYSYRASKAALNQLMHTLSIELRRFNRQSICVTLHPGTTATELSQPFQERVPADQLFSTERAARQLHQVLGDLSVEATGGFFAWDGQPIAW